MKPVRADIWCAAICCACGSALAGVSAAPAPTVNLNVAATNASAYRGITSNPHLLWSVLLDAENQNNVNGVVLDSQGVLYTPDTRPLNSATGAPLTPSGLNLSTGAPAIGADGSIYQWEGSTLHAYHSDRTSYWTAHPYSGTSARGVRVAPNGNVYGRGLDNNLYVYSPSGTLLWSRPCTQQTNSIPVLDANSNVYFDGGGSGVDNAISYDAQGNLRFSVPLNSSTLLQVRLGPDGNLYGMEAQNNQPFVTVRDPTNGSLLRQFSSLTNGVKAIAPNGTLYSAFLHTIEAQTPTGSIRWSVDVGPDVFVSWLVSDSIGNVYCETEENQVLAFASTGAPLWNIQLPVSQSNSLLPIIGADGTIYARSGDFLCAIGGTVPAPGAVTIIGLGGLLATRRRRGV